MAFIHSISMTPCLGLDSKNPNVSKHKKKRLFDIHYSAISLRMSEVCASSIIPVFSPGNSKKAMLTFVANC